MSARLESLEESLKKVCSVLENVKDSPSAAVSSRLEKLEKGLVSSQTTFASITGRQPPAIVVTPVSQQGGGGQPEPVHTVQDGAGALGTGAGTRDRARSSSLKRKADEDRTDSDGFRKPGRQRPRKTASGTSQIKVDGVGEYIAPVEFYIGNTDRRTNEETISKVLKRCAAAVDGGEDLVVEKVELLTKEKDPRTKCWKVVVPFRFKSLMEKDDVYPGGWKHRTFFGSRNAKDKKPRLDSGTDMEQQVLLEQQKDAEKLLQQDQGTDLLTKVQQLESRMTSSMGSSGTPA